MKKDPFGTFIAILAFVALGVFFVTGICGGMFVHEDAAVNALEEKGYTNIRITSKEWFLVTLKGGWKDENVKFVAEAIDPAGENVIVYVFFRWPWESAAIRTS